MFCATSGICLVNQSEQAAGPFVIGWGAGRGLLAERTYEHQQHPASFSEEYRMHSCNMAALSSRIMPERAGRRRRREPSSVTVTASVLSTEPPCSIWKRRKMRADGNVVVFIHSKIVVGWWTNANSGNTTSTFSGTALQNIFFFLNHYHKASASSLICT